MRRINMNNRTKSVLNGILLIVLAACLIMWKLNIFNLPVAFAEVSVVGLIIAAIMVIAVIQNIIDLNYGGIFIPLAVIAIIFDKPLGIEAITPWIVIIAAILLTIAFNMIFPTKKHGWHKKQSDWSKGKFTENSSEDENGRFIMHSTKFGSSTKYIRSNQLEQADLSSQFGQLSVFFDQAQVPTGNVTINVSASFGEMDLYIPKNWNVHNKVNASFGDCDDRCSQFCEVTEDQVQCVINGSVSFGELQLIRI
jgi:predicted membrane protein